MNAHNKHSNASKIIQHRSNVLSAIATYLTSPSITIAALAHMFNISGNDVHNWFCEAVAKKYISKDEICISLMQKHVREYEKNHNIKKSSLRDMYKKAFEARQKGPTFIDVNALIDGNTK